MRRPILTLSIVAAVLFVGLHFADAATVEPRRDAVENAARAPFEDVNVIRAKIPDILLKARDGAYARPSSPTCEALTSEIRQLDDVLGDDFDAPPPDAETAKTAKREAMQADILHEAASSIVPFRGWVRRLSGAQKHAQEVLEAVAAGRVRRGYLKGLGQSMDCPPPAAPQSAPR